MTMRKYDVFADIPELQSLLTGADHIDVKIVTGMVSLREFLAGALSYNPRWLQFLYAVRWGFVRLLGMKQTGIPQDMRLRPADVAMIPGDRAAFFTVKAAAEDRYWIAGAAESHLTAYLGVVVESLDTENRFYVITVVHYNKWTGPVYFNVIRPFHHIVVRKMAQAGVAYRSRPGLVETAG